MLTVSLAEGLWIGVESMASLVSYRGIQVVDPDPVGDGGLAIQNDLKSLVDWSPKSVWDESTDPAASDDEDDDYYPGSYWLRTDTTPPRLFVCESSGVGAAVWRQIPFIVCPVASKTSAYTITLTDSVLLCDASGGAFTITLPTAAGNSGRQFTIKRTNGGSNNVTVAASGGQTIDGASTSVLSTQYAVIRVISNGSSWFIV